MKAHNCARTLQNTCRSTIKKTRAPLLGRDPYLQCRWHGLSQRVMATTLLPRAMEYATLMRRQLNYRGRRVSHGNIFVRRLRKILRPEPHTSMCRVAPCYKGNIPPRMSTPVVTSSLADVGMCHQRKDISPFTLIDGTKRQQSPALNLYFSPSTG